MRTLGKNEMRLLNDPVVKKLQDKIFKMYQTSPTIGKNKDGGYIYPPEVEQYIKNIEREMNDYIKNKN